MIDEPFKRLMCLGCGFSYDEALGLPEHGLAPGTRWAEIPEDWVCPDCGPVIKFGAAALPASFVANERMCAASKYEHLFASATHLGQP